ncbi:MAG: hypothetical protein ACO35C_05375 [Pontimonas sp.]
MPSYSFEAAVPYENAIAVVSCPDVLDRVHGKGMWQFSGWEPDGDAVWKRKGKVKGVEVPQFARVLVGGKRYITCSVTQSYRVLDGAIEVRSRMRPKVAGASVATNTTVLRIQPVRDGEACLVAGTAVNETSIPAPIGPMAVDVMDEMSDETMEFLEDALRKR